MDWREVPTWSEFELLRDAFTAAGVPTIIADPRDLVFDGRALTAAGTRIDLVYRRVLINDIVARPDECRALVDAYRAQRGLRRQQPPLQDSAQEGVLRRADRRALRGAVHSARSARSSRRTCRGRGWSAERLADDLRRRRREQLVLKPNDEYGGTGVTLGWETSESAVGRRDRPRAAGTGSRLGRAGADQRPPGDASRSARRRRRRARHAGGLRAVSVPRAASAGFLTRLSATGLANVTSGGGQVPAFIVVRERTIE